MVLNRKKKNKNKKQKYVSWTDTFHPETATAATEGDASGGGDSNISINSVGSGGDRWSVVWAEATVIGNFNDDDATNDDDEVGDGTQKTNDDPDIEVKATEVGRFNKDEPPPSHSTIVGTSSLARPQSAALVAIDADVGDEGNSTSLQSSSKTCGNLPCSHGNLIDGLLGTLLAMTAVCSVFALDLVAAIVYLLACGAYHGCECLRRTGGVTSFLYFACLPVYAALMLVDGVCLSLSVLVAEVIAGVTYLLCGLFGGCVAANEWHQYVRRICHLTRWAVRGFHAGWVPERVFPVG